MVQFIIFVHLYLLSNPREHINLFMVDKVKARMFFPFETAPIALITVHTDRFFDPRLLKCARTLFVNVVGE